MKTDGMEVKVSYSLIPFFWIFVVVKVMGHAFAAWSWWWLLLPVVPCIGALVQRFAL